MIIKTFTVGPFLTNCYLAACERTTEAVIIDPGFDNQLGAKQIVSTIRDDDMKLRLILNTHGHPDHTCGNGLIKGISRTDFDT
jgi:glyoxylase-like metal-dependent hydrolase (beta-lactamase superfamily II)